MSLHADTVWELRTSGASDNGGGFYDRDPGTSVDYSQQDAAQLTITDLASDGAGTGISSATGGFTAAMAGNVIRIETDGAFTAGWYEITAYTDTNNITIDRTAGANKSNGHAKVGGAISALVDAFFEQLVAGNTAWMKSGTYTLSANVWVMKDGLATAPIKLLGYNDSRGDDPTGNDRPLVQASTHKFSFYSANYWWNKNIRLTTSEAGHGYGLGMYSIGMNLKVTQSNVAAAAYCYLISHRTKLVDCEGASDASPRKGVGVGMLSEGSLVKGCYFHDLTRGIMMGSGAVLVDNFAEFNIIANCDTAIDVNAHYNNILHNTICDCTTGIDGGVTQALLAMYNIIKDCTTGATWSADQKANYWDWNNWYNNTADVSNVTKGANATAVDPQFTDEAADDFSLASGSGCRDIATTISIGVG